KTHPQKQAVAAALNQARRSGAKIPKKSKRKSYLLYECYPVIAFCRALAGVLASFELLPQSQYRPQFRDCLERSLDCGFPVSSQFLTPFPSYAFYLSSTASVLPAANRPESPRGR